MSSFFVPLCELESLVGVVRQEDEGEPDWTRGISNQGDDTRRWAAPRLSADSRLLFSVLMSETVGLSCKKKNNM